jgi:hypothetical protein
MMNLKAIVLATALTLGAAGFAVAEQRSGLDALSSASTLSFETVSQAEVPAVVAGSGLATEKVDLDALKALILGNPKFVAQLESYGASIDDVIGITATDETDVTILVRG